jgi:hypothetical protein
MQGLEMAERASATHAGGPGQDDKWLLSAFVLTLGSLGPNLLAAANFDQVFLGKLQPRVWDLELTPKRLQYCS